MNEHVDCIVCGEDNNKLLFKLNDRLSDSNCQFNLVQCKCGFTFLNPRPDIDNIYKYYNLNNYDPHSNSSTVWTKVYKIVQYFTLRWKLNKIKKYTNSNIRLLDIGGGKGEFVDVASHITSFIYMQDSTPFTSDSNKYTYVKRIELISKSIKFDAITLWHSLEHLHDIHQIFENINNYLDSKGTLFIAVPNINAPERKYYKKSWAPYDVPRHLYHFDISSLERLCLKYNFKIIRKYSLYQDTPYNVLLSNNILNILTFLKTIYVIIISLIKTMFMGPNYSSSILVICKRK